MSDFATWVEKNRALWTRVYDEVIAPDFEKEWEKREEWHRNELKQKDENQQLLFNNINEQIVKNARVVEENERLETELQQRAESAALSTNLEDASTTSTGVPDEPHRELAKKYDELSKKYQDLSQKVNYLERKNNAVMQKNRDMKESVRAWQQYADRQKPHQKLKGATRTEEGSSRVLAVPQSDEIPPHMPSNPKPVSTVCTPLQHASWGRSSPPGVLRTDTGAGHETVPHEDGEQSPSKSVTPKGPTAASFNEHQGVTHGDPSLNARSDRTRRYHVETNGAPSSSQTTVDEGTDQTNRRTQAVDEEDEDDSPQVVSERSLKRKRGQQSRIDVYTGRSSDGTLVKPHRIKDEPLSSPPPTMHVLMRTETIDLDDPAADNIEAARPAQTPSGSGESRKSASNARPNQQQDIVPDGRPIWSMRASEKRPSAQKHNTPPSDKQSRLREKPVKELKVHDFKPNPAYNQGYSYAFSEAVRKRGDRMCLPGCTNPQCCGSHFRRLAEALDPLPAAQEEALLEEYLGDAYSTVISTQVSSHEHAELILQARTKKMAKDNGKHRAACERRRTPPGFWRVDFPTTQEQEDDRGRAKEQEIKAVQERWLEAQKKGGQWLFRDE